ncbi:hypothetical protein [Anaerotruncus rubiinfantis]|uniref:hypothetical protein n=1 Tax=Anaerotruncus rubiinfantis TaxID=1720200 RepID=UPI0034A47A90
MSVPSYEQRILEIHGINMWNMFHVDRAIRFAKHHKMTGIAFHCNELIDKVVFPEKYFTKDELLKYNPVRNSITKNYRYYLRSVLDRCAENDLAFYAEIKEIYFPYDLITKYPQLRGENGALCATNPFWWEFIEEKYKEFFELFPDVAGVIVSPGTRESMVSFAANQCTCERCRNYDVDDWYRNLLVAMHNATSAFSKKLVVRDFSYTKAHQYAMVDAARSVASDIAMSMKKVPHDYYPIFPDNPAVGNCGELDQWIEFDTWGQFFGLGVFPCSVAEDMQGRMQRYLGKSAKVIMLRTDWENMTQSSVFCSFNMLNLIAGAMLSYDINTSMDEIYEAWFEEGLVTPLLQDTFAQVPSPVKDEHTKAALHEMMTRNWKIIEKAIHVRGHVFNRNCQFFDRYDLTYNIMTVFHSRDQWEPGASKRVEPTEENIRLMLLEKEEAAEMVRSLKELVNPENLVLSEPIAKYLRFMADGFLAYVEGFQLECATTVYTKRAEQTRLPEHVEQARKSLAGYEELAERCRALTVGKDYSHVVCYMLDGQRLLRFKADVQKVLDAIETQS